MNYPFFETTNHITEKFLINNHKEYYDMLFEMIVENNISLSERIYLFQNNLIEKPYCANCTNKVKFRKFYLGYRKYCCKSCAATDTHKNPKIKENRIKNMHNACVEKRLEISNKISTTKLSKSNIENEIINKKRENTNIEIYGEKNVSQVKEIKEKIGLNSSIEKKKGYTKKIINLIISLGYIFNSMDDKTINLHCNECDKDFVIFKYLLHQRKRKNNTICTICNKTDGKSDFENKIHNFIKNNCNLEILQGYRKFRKYEIDIYIPELKLGFECDGLFWHCEKYRDENYHIDKLNFFKEKGIRIINIWEDDWKLNENIIKNIILFALNKINNIVPFEQCIIKIIDDKNANEFLHENSLTKCQKYDIKIGLYYNNKLIYIMCFNKIEKDIYILTEYCSMLNIIIDNVFPNIIQYFLYNYNVNKIISYIDLSYNDGNDISKNGFNLINYVKPNSFYFHKDIGIRNVNTNLSKGYYRIWNCGYSLYSLNNPKD